MIPPPTRDIGQQQETLLIVAVGVGVLLASHGICLPGPKCPEYLAEKRLRESPQAGRGAVSGAGYLT